MRIYFCFVFENETIRGDLDLFVSKYLTIYMYFNSDNETEWEEAKSNFSSSNIESNPFQLMWFDNTVNVDNLVDPVEKIFMTTKLYLDFFQPQELNLYLSKIEFSNDDNIFYPNKIMKNLSFVSSMTKNSYPKRDNFSKRQLLFKTNLYFSQKVIKIERKYKKLSEFLAAFGSINTNLLIFLTIFVNFINQFWAEQKLMNKLFKFREHMKVNNPNEINLFRANFFKTNVDSNHESTNKNISFQSFKEDVETIQHQNKEKPVSFSLEMTEKKEISTPFEINIETLPRQLSVHRKCSNKSWSDHKIEKGEKLLKEMKKPIVFRCYDILLSPICCRSTNLHIKNLLYQKGLKKINNYLDIITYLKKMQEIDLLKYLILDKDQVKLFNFLSMPSISIQFSDSDDYYKEVLNFLVSNVKLDSVELHQLIKSYNSLKNKEDGVNNRLLNLFANEVDHLLIDN